MIESFEKTRLAGSIAAGALDEVNNIIKPPGSEKEKKIKENEKNKNKDNK